MLEILLDNKNGKVWNLSGYEDDDEKSGIVSGVTWKTSRIGKPGSLDFTMVKGGLYQAQDFQYNNGDIIRFRKDGRNVFYGYIFSIDEGKDEAVKISCYDQIRYLTASDTYVLSNITASDVIQRIAKDFGLKTGALPDTGYHIPTMVEDGQQLLDIISKALTLTLKSSGRNFALYDDFGSLTLLDTDNTVLDIIIGDGSLMYDYNVKRSIDTDTYNKIKLYKDNKDSGKRELYVAQDSANIAKWGTLQLYQSVDENMNAAQINELLNTLVTLKNRESKTLKLKAIGDIRVRAGIRVNILIQEYGVNQNLLVDECTHTFDGADHTMDLELKVV